MLCQQRVVVEEMPRSLPCVLHLLRIDLYDHEVLVEYLSFRDRLAGRRNDLRTTPKIHAVLHTHAIDEYDITSQQPRIRRMVLAVDRVIFDLGACLRIFAGIEPCRTRCDRYDHLRAVMRKYVWKCGMP